MGRNLNRQPRLISLKDTPHGWIRLAICTTCGHRGPLPAKQLIRKHGELAVVEFALMGIKCSECGGRGASASMIRLCEPGCPKRRG